MNIVDDRREIVRFARRARARQILIRGLVGFQRGFFYALLLALLALIAAKIFGLAVPWVAEVEALGALVLLATLLQAFLPPVSLFEAACRVDEQAVWKERLSSALVLPSVTHPMEHALVDDVRDRLKGQSASRLFPIRAARELKWVPVAGAAIALTALLFPALDVLGVEAKQKETEKNKEELKSAVQKLEERKKKLEKEDRPLDRVKEAIKKLDALAHELHKDPPPERKDALAKISNLAEELEKMKHELSKTEAMAEKLQKALSKDAGETGELGQKIKAGKFMEAAQQLAKIRNDLQQGKLSQADKDKLEKQLEKLMEKLGKDKDLKELEKKLAKAMQGLEQDNEKDLNDLQQSLQNLDSEMTESEMLAEALKDLERLTDALAKDAGECPS